MTKKLREVLDLGDSGSVYEAAVVGRAGEAQSLQEFRQRLAGFEPAAYFVFEFVRVGVDLEHLDRGDEKFEALGLGLEEVYEDGIDRTKEALTKKKLAMITFDVQDDVKDLQNRIGANKSKFSEEEYRKIFDAQNKFYDAVEKRDKELSR